jgi:hypothetical protein
MKAIVLTAALALSATGAVAAWDIKTDTLNGEAGTSAIVYSVPNAREPDRVALALGCHRNELSVMLVPERALMRQGPQRVHYRVDDQPVGRVNGRNQTGAVLDLEEAPKFIAKLRAGKGLVMRFYAGSIRLQPEWSLDGIEEAVAAVSKQCSSSSMQ